MWQATLTPNGCANMPPPTSLEMFWSGLIAWLWVIASIAAGAWIIRAILLAPMLKALHLIAKAIEYLPASAEARRINPPP